MNSVEKAILRPFAIDGEALGMHSAGVAESRAEAHDGSAICYEENGRADLAKREREVAAWWRGLSEISDEAAERLLIEFQLRKPELFREWARRHIAIPGLISRKTEQSRENKKLLESLKQGEDCGLAVLPTGKRGKSWSLKGAALTAVQLVAHIRSSNLCYESDKAGAGGEYPELPDWRHQAAKLAPFSKRTARKWAEVGWLVLAEISPKNQPERHHVLKKQFKVRQYRIDYPSRTGAKLNVEKVRRKSPSIATHDMKETLRAAFERIASDKSGGPSRTRKGKHQGRKLRRAA